MTMSEFDRLADECGCATGRAADMRNSSRRLRIIAHRCQVWSGGNCGRGADAARVNTILSTAAPDGDARATRDELFTLVPRTISLARAACW